MRFRISAGVLAIAVAMVWLTTNTAADQQAGGASTAKPAATAGAKPAASTGKPYKAPRTPDGQPDLGGFWSNATYTPLQRDPKVTKEFYTPEEFAKLRKDRQAADEEQTTPGTNADVHYDFTQFGLDKSQHTIAQNLRTSQIIDPPDGRLPPTVAAAGGRGQGAAGGRGQGAAGGRGGQYDRVQNMPNGSRCIIMGGAGPPLRDAGYNSTYHIVQGQGTVMVLTEMIHDARIIPLDKRPAPAESLKQWVGMSRGRWEGETLVVETTNFNGRNPFQGSSDQLKVTERFTRTSDDQIEYKFTVEDPQTWTRPWTALNYLQKMNGPIFEFACHESNIGVSGILGGARADEKRAAEGAAAKPGSK